ncbi:hypothetical protein DPEC_G00235440 [Dallia pectoralis]|uniref:Uncharacterized protein n=1 Tax=Dallia pectoralis TaxID=75939 RepID=A0ACC2FXY1_DALPE|nr:hypothetical protein DPEC_G00235440 [Dallia pectoralis]
MASRERRLPIAVPVHAQWRTVTIGRDFCVLLCQFYSVCRSSRVHIAAMADDNDLPMRKCLISTYHGNLLDAGTSSPGISPLPPWAYSRMPSPVSAVNPLKYLPTPIFAKLSRESIFSFDCSKDEVGVATKRPRESF